MKKLILILFIFFGVNACVIDKEVSSLTNKVTKVLKTEKKEPVVIKKVSKNNINKAKKEKTFKYVEWKCYRKNFQDRRNRRCS